MEKGLKPTLPPPPWCHIWGAGRAILTTRGAASLSARLLATQYNALEHKTNRTVLLHPLNKSLSTQTGTPGPTTCTSLQHCSATKQWRLVSGGCCELTFIYEGCIHK